MAKIYILMGKSASGKDTIYRRLLENPTLHLKPVILYTTRPIRSGEEDGREYFFVDEAKMRALEAAGKLIECRTYQTVHGAWHYFTADDGQIELTGEQDYLMIDTLEGYVKLKEYFGAEHTEALYIEVEDGLRLARALERERGQEQPKYAEMCRRFLADEEDFAKSKREQAGILKKYGNEQLEKCLEQLEQHLRR